MLLYKSYCTTNNKLVIGKERARSGVVAIGEQGHVTNEPKGRDFLLGANQVKTDKDRVVPRIAKTLLVRLKKLQPLRKGEKQGVEKVRRVKTRRTS